MVALRPVFFSSSMLVMGLFPPGALRVGAVLNRYGFMRVQGSVYVSQGDSLVNVTQAMNALRALSWFPTCVRDIRAFKVEHWSDFTDFMKS